MSGNKKVLRNDFHKSVRTAGHEITVCDLNEKNVVGNHKYLTKISLLACGTAVTRNWEKIDPQTN